MAEAARIYGIADAVLPGWRMGTLSKCFFPFLLPLFIKGDAMRQYVNGKMVELPVDRDGCVDSDAIRRAAGLPSDRQLILQSPDGGNRIVNPGERIALQPGQSSTDAPLHKRGR